MAAPLPILQTLWNADTAEARLISNRLVELSLAQTDDKDESIRLHDLQLDYVRAQYPDKEAPELIHGAVRLSSNAIAKDPRQFSSQLVGRLLAYKDMPAIKQFTERIAKDAPRPWLRPLQANLHPPGTSLVRTFQGHTVAKNGERFFVRADCHAVVFEPSVRQTQGTKVATFVNLQYISGFLLVVHSGWDSFDQLRTRIRNFPLSGFGFVGVAVTRLNVPALR